MGLPMNLNVTTVLVVKSCRGLPYAVLRSLTTSDQAALRYVTSAIARSPELSIEELHRVHRALNTVYFEGKLPEPVIRIALPNSLGLSWGKIQPKLLGAFIDVGDHHEIWFHKNIAPYDIVGTLAHEMVHQWQCMLNLPTDHEAPFKLWAVCLEASLGIDV